MTETAKKFMNMSKWTSIAFFVLRCLIGWGELAEIRDGTDVFKGGYTLLGYTGEAIAITAIFMACFNKYFWKWNRLNWIFGMPVLAKKYKGKIRFIWENEEHERDITVGIVQTFLGVTVKICTDESKSNSVMGTITEINGSKTLMYTYLNIPKAEIQDRSAIHFGTAILDIDNPKHITGNYFTMRQSRGSVDLKAENEG